jgi:hypothetical protein
MGIILDLLEYIPWQKRGRNILEKVEKNTSKGGIISVSTVSLSVRTVAAATVVLCLNSGERAAHL